jgi:hypothetical protein
MFDATSWCAGVLLRVKRHVHLPAEGINDMLGGIPGS